MSAGNEMPLVSIVTPSYNQAKYLPATINSVLSQEYPRIEYIVVDGGSTDGCLDILKEHSEGIDYWVSEPDAGQTDAINKGFDRAAGQIFAWLNSDDIYKPGAIAEAVAFLQAHPEVGMVYGDADFIDEQGNWYGRFPTADTSYRKLRQGYVHIPQQATFFRSRLWRLVGPLDTSFNFAMDYDLWVRIAALSPIAHVRRIWASFRLHQTAKSLTSADQCWPEMMKVHRRLGGGSLSVIGLKYAIRRILEPVLPYRLFARLWLQRWAIGKDIESSGKTS